MKTLREEISKNAGINYLNECVKVKEMEAMSKAYSAFASFARDIQSLKCIYEPRPMGMMMMGMPHEELSPEDREMIQKKIKDFCMKKLDYLKDIVEETFSEKEDDDEGEIKVEIDKVER